MVSVAREHTSLTPGSLGAHYIAPQAQSYCSADANPGVVCIYRANTVEHIVPYSVHPMNQQSCVALPAVRDVLPASSPERPL